MNVNGESGPRTASEARCQNSDPASPLFTHLALTTELADRHVALRSRPHVHQDPGLAVLSIANIRGSSATVQIERKRFSTRRVVLGVDAFAEQPHRRDREHRPFLARGLR